MRHTESPRPWFAESAQPFADGLPTLQLPDCVSAGMLIPKSAAWCGYRERTLHIAIYLVCERASSLSQASHWHPDGRPCPLPVELQAPTYVPDDREESRCSQPESGASVMSHAGESSAHYGRGSCELILLMFFLGLEFHLQIATSSSCRA